MKLVNNNMSPLPFYDDIAQQNHRKDYAFGQIYPLITYRNMLLPFQVVIPSSWINLGGIALVNFNTGDRTNISADIKENGITIKRYANFNILIYPGTLPISKIKHEGLYYLIIQVNGHNLYSEVFTAMNNVNDYLLIEYSNSYNFELKNGMVDFSDNFKFKCYLNTQIGKPEYDFEEEVTERMGYSFIESQVSKKIYKFIFVAPEYLCDALRIVRFCENKKAISKNQEYDMTTFSMKPEWQDQGDLAAVECEFETDTVIANIGGYTPKLLGGDYNGDYDNDYKIEG